MLILLWSIKLDENESLVRTPLQMYSEGIMFKDSNVFEFDNFPFKAQYNNAVYSVNRNYLFSIGK